MRKYLKFMNTGLLSGTLGLVLSAAVMLLPLPANAGDFSLLYTGDSHSHLDSTGPKDDQLRGTIGGLTKASSIIAQIKGTDANALFVHTGDLFMGDLYFSATIGPGGAPALAVPEMQILAGLGLDVMALGNHEFGLGSDALAATLWAGFGGEGPSVLAANVDLTDTSLEGLVTPRTVKEVGGVNVGFFGLTIPDWMSMEAPFLPESYSAEGMIYLAATEAATLRESGADVVVCVAHLGSGLEEAIAAYAPGIDVVIGGHDHAHLEEPLYFIGPDGREGALVKAGQFYEYLGYLQVSYEEGQVTFPGHSLLHVDETVPRHPYFEGEVLGLQAVISAHYGEDFWGDQIGYALVDVTKEVVPPKRDTGIGNLITDALRSAGGTDIAVTAEGFFTEGLYAGPLVGADAFRIVGNGIDPAAGPGYALYRAEITGQNLLNALETSIELMGTAQGLTPDDFFLQVSGMRFVFDSSRTEPPRVVRAWVGGPPLNPDRVYTVTLNYGNLLGLEMFPNVEFVGEPELIEGVDEYAAVRDLIQGRRILFYVPRGRSVDLAQVGHRRR
ncbi:MAG: bifunctional metallophosphatase/5'-nucleotidase [Deltaproteobacteria bacterium]|nr:bifunctional metallophosphatase/5'-nucleotidase [Deltaproteobacteria bacterium]